MGKIDPVKLDELLKNGKSPKQCADYFECSQAAISQMKRRLRRAVTNSVAMEKAPQVVDQNLNSVAQLQKINESANELLDTLMAWQRGDAGALRVMESQVKKLVWKDGQTGEDREIDVKEIKLKDPRELAVKVMAEIRGQLKLQLEIFQSLYDMKAVQEFQQEVVKAIGEVDPDVRDRIIYNLRQKRAVRSAISFDQ